ncbi:carnosine N-methyltransferase-like, partial [Lingula anatina]|uniref:carnosine N-methyltransferase n=1 Tax=Lingula anatina TaxID=7574 RepID=A0A2R2MKC3_LINAN
NEWTLIFKAVARAGGNVLDLWNSSQPLNENNAEARKLNSTLHQHYKSSSLGAWETLGVTRAKVALYDTNGVEVVQLVFNASGTNKFSWFARDRLLSSTYVDILSADTNVYGYHFGLVGCHSIEIYTIHPWVHQWCNNMSNADQLKAVKFPDINPSEMPSKSEFSMAAGDFLEVYTEADTWDCIATVFFIDTAHNVIAYLETIWKILKPGGYWINMGPLLYHFADMPNELSIELSYEDVKKVILQLGFLILEEKTNIKSGYTENPKSMLKYVYDCVYFVAQKPLTGS